MEYKVAVQHGDAKLVTALLIEAQCPQHARTTAIVIAYKFGLEKASVIGIEYKVPNRRSSVEDRRSTAYGGMKHFRRQNSGKDPHPFGRRTGDKARWAS